MFIIMLLYFVFSPFNAISGLRLVGVLYIEKIALSHSAEIEKTHA